jgi:hypothetical protein
MKTEKVIVNGISIECPTHEGQNYVAVKPICEALGIDHSAQIRDLKDDRILSSVVVSVTTTGSDGKQYQMTCIPIKFVFGWLFSINEKRVKPEARENIVKYKRECYDALYEHFYGKANKQTASLSKSAELEAEKRKILNKAEKSDDLKQYLEIEKGLKQERSTRSANSRQAFAGMLSMFSEKEMNQ